MRVITGMHLEQTGQNDAQGKPKMAEIVDSVQIPDQPRKLSDFPKEAIAATGTTLVAGGMIRVVTVDGKKFDVSDDSGTAKAGVTKPGKADAKD